VKLSLRHRTGYRFDRPVFLEPHIIRLRPRVDGTLRLIETTLAIDPPPAVRAENLDLEGNAVTQVWFDGKTDHLIIESRSTIETLRTDPFQFLLDGPSGTLPYTYPADWNQRLSAYRNAPEQVSSAVRALALSTADEAAQQRDRFPAVLTDRLHEDYAIEYREDGPPRDPAATLALKSGACRDLAVLFVECCRSVGLAARFVSGYAHVDDAVEQEFHAWAEVYLPGGGWRGYDPTLGLAVADRHVVVAAAADPADAAGISGTYRGSAVATLESAVEISVVPPDSVSDT
jgi:transglutaminase-like putative cysteine protease